MREVIKDGRGKHAQSMECECIARLLMQHLMKSHQQLAQLCGLILADFVALRLLQNVQHAAADLPGYPGCEAMYRL